MSAVILPFKAPVRRETERERLVRIVDKVSRKWRLGGPPVRTERQDTEMKLLREIAAALDARNRGSDR